MATAAPSSCLPLFCPLAHLVTARIAHTNLSCHSRTFTPVLQPPRFNFPPYLITCPRSCSQSASVYYTRRTTISHSLHHLLEDLVVIYVVLPVLPDNLSLPSHHSPLDPSACDPESQCTACFLPKFDTFS